MCFSEEQSRLAARKYARVVQKLGFPARFLDFKIQNMVASCDVCFPIRLEGLVLTHQQFSRYKQRLIFLSGQEVLWYCGCVSINLTRLIWIIVCYVIQLLNWTLCVSVSSYEPELFPGLIYRMVKPRIVLLIFVSGKVVLTGKETLLSGPNSEEQNQGHEVFHSNKIILHSDKCRSP